jgi:hypothetical protein
MRSLQAVGLLALFLAAFASLRTLV